MKNRKLVLIVVIVFTFLAFRSVNEDDRYFQIVKNLDIFTTLFKEVNAYYVEDINPGELMKIGIDAMLSSLDPYTDYIPEDDIEDYRTMTTGEYGGIGAIVARKGGINTIVMPYENSPAIRAGLLIGDQILKINGVDLSNKRSHEIGKLLRSQTNSTLELEIQRLNRPESFIVNLNTQTITIKNVPYAGLIANEVGYIKLTDFTSQAGEEVANALTSLKSQGASKIILDLRGNPGGLLGEAINVSNIFLPKGNEVVSTRGKLESWTKVYNTQNQPIDIEIPLVILTDNSSASASEIVAGVVQDYDRGILVGRKTYGKGLVQQTRPLAYNAQIKVTTAKYYIPSGRCIQAIDYSTRNEDGSVGKIADSLKSEFQTANGRLVYDGGGVDPDIAVDPEEFSQVSYQLMRKNLIFDYATRYYFEHEKIAEARDFKLTDDDFEQFAEWLSKMNFDYTTPLEVKVEELSNMAKKESRSALIKEDIAQLQLLINHDKVADLNTYKSEIIQLLEQDIVSRYYLQGGIIETTFDDDPDIVRALEVLSDMEFYQRLLKSN
jgi:carboxyl-terminal processing protease